MKYLHTRDQQLVRYGPYVAPRRSTKRIILQRPVQEGGTNKIHIDPMNDNKKSKQYFNFTS